MLRADAGIIDSEKSEDRSFAAVLPSACNGNLKSHKTTKEA
jgi:hypothetical protein